MTIARCESPNELLTELYRVQIVPNSGIWVFRGQALATSWRLEPSLFRLGLKDEQQERQFERDLVDHLRQNLASRSMVPERYLSDEDDLLAFAQHYGCPTRMLDWTLSPLVAAYFAASGSLKYGSTEPLAVFAVAGITSIAAHSATSKIVYPRAGSNPNLAAQSGVLIRHGWTCRDYWQDQFEQPVTASSPSVTGRLDSRFIRFELPAKLAGSLLDELRRRNVDGVTVFPSLHGFAALAFDHAWHSTRRILGQLSEPDDDEPGTA